MMPPKVKKVTAPPEAYVAPVLCGHINRHSMGLDKKPDNLVCDLRKNHHGDHEGWHSEYQRKDVTEIIKGEEVSHVAYDEVSIRRQWGDMAGIPLSEIPTPAPVAPPTMAELDRRMAALERKGAR